MRARFAYLLPSALVAVSSVIHAEPAARLSRPRFSTLPVAELPKALDPTSAPSTVSGTEHVEGLDVTEVASPSRSRARRSLGPIAINPSRKDAQAPITLIIKQDREACATETRGQLPTFSVGQQVFSTIGPGTVLIRPVVHPFRYERLVRGPERAYLEVVDVWLDAKTQGARIHQRSEVPLARLAQGPLGIEVFGFRDKEHVWMIASVPERGAAIRARTSGLTACGHVRTSLKLKNSGSATNVLIGMNGERPRTDNELANRARLAGDAPAFSAVGIAASVSRLSRDSEPVVSVSISPVAPALKRALASAMVSVGR